MQVRRVPGPDRKSLVVAMEQLNGQTGKVGWFESAKYEDGKPVAGVMAAQEFGVSGRFPPRPFFRPTAAAQKQSWADTSKQVAQAVVRGQMAPGSVLEALCLKAEGDVRQAIINVTSPALKESTIAARKRKLAKGTKFASTIEKPLEASGHALATLTSKVE